MRATVHFLNVDCEAIRDRIALKLCLVCLISWLEMHFCKKKIPIEGGVYWRLRWHCAIWSGNSVVQSNALIWEFNGARQCETILSKFILHSLWWYAFTPWSNGSGLALKWCNPKSVILRTQRLSTTQFDDLRLPCEWISLECRYCIPFTMSWIIEAMNISSSLTSSFSRISYKVTE